MWKFPKRLRKAGSNQALAQLMLSWLLLIFCLFSNSVFAQTKIVNVYAWTGEIPDFIVKQFEKETGIKVNFSTYENNEIMYAKIRAVKNAGYDVIMPSSYFVDRMRRQNMLIQLDQSKLTNLAHLNPSFAKPIYDPTGNFCVPFIWGITGIFYNANYFKEETVQKWNDLWQPQLLNKLLMLDDTREVFSMALISLGFSANDRDPQHIKQAYLKLKQLMPNIKVFSTETVVSILIDEDATIGMAWNGDAYKASLENPHVKFVFPKDGFVVWVDNFSIPRGAPHINEAYQFINFMMRPDIAKAVALYTNFPITNLSGQQLLPDDIKNNQTIYPSKETLAKGQFQADIGDDTLALYEKYWEDLKMGG